MMTVQLVVLVPREEPLRAGAGWSVMSPWRVRQGRRGCTLLIYEVLAEHVKLVASTFQRRDCLPWEELMVALRRVPTAGPNLYCFWRKYLYSVKQTTMVASKIKERAYNTDTLRSSFPD